ncbi:thioredoxin family protein [Chloroflexus sp.]|uniref:thioredoxin family protein n=1 Tax=Chloroflexus sp. TaxID=1904827 RepID=UPI00298F105E|nr:thioredoxin family protein [Chloroflexus sp.]MCS6888486.1 thioredoxin family protein [Chloroflexus sp.]MDW8402963.1 thioredoxin family protein [Chloroflexus sp.]
MEVIERLFIIAALAAGILLIWRGLRRWHARRLHALHQATPFAGMVPLGQPAVIAFSTPGCRECRTRQAPALAQLATLMGEQVVVATLSAPEHPQLIARLGILTAPATVVLDAYGVVQQVNQGFADAATLARQVRAVLPQAAALSTPAAGSVSPTTR